MKDNNKGRLQVFAGVGLLTAALLIHVGLNINPNNKTRQVAINDFKKITASKDLEEDRKDKRKGR